MNPGHTRPGSLRPGFTRLPDGRGRMVVFAEKLSSGEQFRAELRLTKGTLYSAAERVDCTTTRTAHLADLRLIEDGTQQTQDGWFWVRTYEELHATAETLSGAPRVLRGDDGRVTVEQDWLQLATAKATPQRVGTTTCPTWPVAYTGVTGTAATDTFTLTAHGLLAGDPVRFSALTGGAGLATGTTYYVIASGLTADAFKLSATSGGSAINFTTDITAATLALYRVAILATEQAPDNGTLRTITRTYVTNGLLATRETNLGGGLKEVTWVSAVTRQDPAGIIVDVDTQKPSGVPVYSVKALQLLDGSSPAAGTLADSFTGRRQFEIPGRVRFSQIERTIGAVDFTFIDTQLSSPVIVDTESTTYVYYSTDSAIDIGTLPTELTGLAVWNPVEWPSLSGFWLVDETLGGGRSKFETLPRYRIASDGAGTYATPPSLSVTIPFSSTTGALAVAFGSLILTGYEGEATLSGGPVDPCDDSWIVDYGAEPAFVDNDGTPYYRHTYVVAAVPAQADLPTLA